jgi:hypothetical protein
MRTILSLRFVTNLAGSALPDATHSIVATPLWGVPPMLCTPANQEKIELPK